MIDATTAESKPLKLELTNFGRRQPACRALVEMQYGIGGLIAVAVWSELGDCARFSRSLQVVRHTGLDVTVDQSDRRRANGFLSRQGPETLRWALYEAAKNSSHATAPDHDYYAAVKKAHDAKLAAISVARKIARRCYHTLRSVDPEMVYATPPTRAPALLVGGGGRGCPFHTSGSRGRKLPIPACVPVFVPVSLYTLSRPRSHDEGVTQSRLLSPTMASSSTEVTLGAPRPSICRYITGRLTRRFKASLVSTYPSYFQGGLTTRVHTGNAGWVALLHGDR